MPTRSKPVAYLIRKGTNLIVRKPSGEIVGHPAKEDCVFQPHEKVSEHKTVQFQRDGFLVSVPAADVTEVQSKCPQCGARTALEGLCDACRQTWLPRR